MAAAVGCAAPLLLGGLCAPLFRLVPTFPIPHPAAHPPPAECHGLELRVKGNGLRYKCIIRTDPGWDAVGYTLAFDTQNDGEAPGLEV